MKSKLMIASLLLAGACAANLNAQEKTNYYTPKWSDNIFVSVGGGIHAINNDGFNKIAPHFSVSVGKLITPTWGVRAQVNGITQHLCLDDAYWEHNKTYVGGNIDAMINLSTLFAGANPKLKLPVRVPSSSRLAAPVWTTMARLTSNWLPRF